MGLSVPDINEKHTLFLKNSVLNHWPNNNDPNADVTLAIKRADLTEVLAKQVWFAEAAKIGLVALTGNSAKFTELMGCIFDLSQSFRFNIVTP